MTFPHLWAGPRPTASAPTAALADAAASGTGSGTRALLGLGIVTAGALLLAVTLFLVRTRR
ncbi:hypothetical protein, partial [Streptomyces sp. NPDC093261]|uniref:hypothetical protein n=1 Tax=Streptomyces sp. NPDC093261 TaxID=3366037 RepID=UPI0037F35009